MSDQKDQTTYLELCAHFTELPTNQKFPAYENRARFGECEMWEGTHGPFQKTIGIVSEEVHG